MVAMQFDLSSHCVSVPFYIGRPGHFSGSARRGRCVPGEGDSHPRAAAAQKEVAEASDASSRSLASSRKVQPVTLSLSALALARPAMCPVTYTGILFRILQWILGHRPSDVPLWPLRCLETSTVEQDNLEYAQACRPCLFNVYQKLSPDGGPISKGEETERPCFSPGAPPSLLGGVCV